MCQNENKAKYKGKFHHTLISGKTTHYTPFEKFKSMVHRGKIKKKHLKKIGLSNGIPLSWSGRAIFSVIW